MGENDLKCLKTEFLDDKWKFLTAKLAYPYEIFKCVDDYQKPVKDLKKDDFLSKLKSKCPSDEKIEPTKGIIKEVNIKNGEKLMRLYLKCDFSLIASRFFFINKLEEILNTSDDSDTGYFVEADSR